MTQARRIQLVPRRRASTTARTRAATATAASTWWLWRRQRERDELRTRVPRTAHADDDELTTLIQVRHRQTRLRSRDRRLPDIATRRLVVRIEHRHAAG